MYMQMCIYKDTYYHEGNLYKNSLHKYAEKTCLVSQTCFQVPVAWMSSQMNSVVNVWENREVCPLLRIATLCF
jgi:hypothetical protein